jgi:hypothetical protein
LFEPLALEAAGVLNMPGAFQKPNGALGVAPALAAFALPRVIQD